MGEYPTRSIQKKEIYSNNGYYSLSQFGAEGMLGSMVVLILVMELGPVLTALIGTGRAGYAMCAELGITPISKQIDTLGCMATDSSSHHPTGKFLAALFSVPLLTAIFDVVGIVGGYLKGIRGSVTSHDTTPGSIIRTLVFGRLVV